MFTTCKPQHIDHTACSVHAGTTASDVQNPVIVASIKPYHMALIPALGHLGVRQEANG